MASKPCPFCDALATYQARAKSARSVWRPARYCSDCETMFVVRGVGQPEGGEPVMIVAPLAAAQIEAVEGAIAEAYMDD